MASAGVTSEINGNENFPPQEATTPSNATSIEAKEGSRTPSPSNSTTIEAKEGTGTPSPSNSTTIEAKEGTGTPSPSKTKTPSTTKTTPTKPNNDETPHKNLIEDSDENEAELKIDESESSDDEKEKKKEDEEFQESDAGNVDKEETTPTMPTTPTKSNNDEIGSPSASKTKTSSTTKTTTPIIENATSANEEIQSKLGDEDAAAKIKPQQESSLQQQLLTPKPGDEDDDAIKQQQQAQEQQQQSLTPKPGDEDDDAIKQQQQPQEQQQPSTGEENKPEDKNGFLKIILENEIKELREEYKTKNIELVKMKKKLVELNGEKEAATTEYKKLMDEIDNKVKDLNKNIGLKQAETGKLKVTMLKKREQEIDLDLDLEEDDLQITYSTGKRNANDEPGIPPSAKAVKSEEKSSPPIPTSPTPSSSKTKTPKPEFAICWNRTNGDNLNPSNFTPSKGGKYSDEAMHMAQIFNIETVEKYLENHESILFYSETYFKFLIANGYIKKYDGLTDKQMMINLRNKWNMTKTSIPAERRKRFFETREKMGMENPKIAEKFAAKELRYRN